ncbi:DNA helicase MCM [Acrasis kona]|uniref:Minichromosome maintenance 8 n=1 Tax=Acrasis kona TaxID=1008807 RepID=A0AAW2Z780_9EUKA
MSRGRGRGGPRRTIDDDDDNEGSFSSNPFVNRPRPSTNSYNNDDNDDEQNHDFPSYWNFYFPGESYFDTCTEEAKEFINNFELFFKEMSSDANDSTLNDTNIGENKKKLLQCTMGDAGEKLLHLDYNLIKNVVPNLSEELYSKPNGTISRIEVAAHKAFSTPQENDLIKHTVRIYNFDRIMALKNFKSPQIGKFVCVKGTVVRVSNIKQVATQMSFECQKCHAIMKRHFVENTFNPPIRCKNKNCKSKKFEPNRYNAVTADWQRIRIQEIIEKDVAPSRNGEFAGDDPYEAGRMPRTVDCEISKDLVESCVPGDQVTVCGVIKVISTDQNAEGGGFRGGNSRGKSNCMYLLYLEGNSVSNSKNNSDKMSKKNNSSSSAMGDPTEFSLNDLFLVKEIAAQDNLFHLIVNSVCPAIYGHEVVKAGLALSLFGGVQRYTNTKHKLPVRGDPHLLIVGDPGLGKSQLLTAVSHVAPRGVYVCGNTTTTSGLTVTVVKDQGSGDFSLEAGALVLADQGCCCIDEFDKMRSEHQALLEAMEQQSISIAKAGIVCNLPARCSVMAAANPVGGHYNRAKTVSENLKISPALLSRFDLIFILLDSPDELRDELLSNHVMSLHVKTQNKTQRKDPSFTQMPQTQLMSSVDKKKSLKERLVKEKSFEHLPAMFLRKYIAYARKYCHPKLSDEAKDVLQRFYMSLREKHQSSDSTPITTRQLESLVRLAQGRAKLELREVVTIQDAFDVVEIMQESMYDILTDEFGQVDFRRNAGSTKGRDVNRFIDDLTRRGNHEGRSTFSKAELFHIYKNELHMDGTHFEKFIEKLNFDGYFIKTSPNGYKLTTCVEATTPSRGRASGGSMRSLPENHHSSVPPGTFYDY